MTIQERFDKFHSANPWVYKKLLEMTEDLHRRGIRKTGMKMLWEVLRWKIDTGEILTHEDFRLNNVFTSRYARKIADSSPTLARMFDQRRLVAP
jgi:hypothetical protein